MRHKVILFLLRILKIKASDIKLVDYQEYTSKLIEDMIKKSGFVELGNSTKLHYIKGFTLIEVIKTVSKDKNPIEYISEVNIKHDIDYCIGNKIKFTSIKCKVKDLQLFIKYFNNI